MHANNIGISSSLQCGRMVSQRIGGSEMSESLFSPPLLCVNEPLGRFLRGSGKLI